MSTADHAEHPLGPPASSAGGASRRAPYADGGGTGRAREESALRRLADGDSGSPAPTAPVPVNGAPTTTALPAAPTVPTAPPATVPTPPAATVPTPPAETVPSAPPAPTQERRAAHTRAPSSPAPRSTAARRVRLTVSRVDPWSAMKISFLLSVALGIAGVVMVFVLWTILAGMGVFDQVNGIIGQVVQDGQQRFDIMDFIGLGRVLSLSIVIAVIDVILITAIATLGAFLYNVSSALVGGVQLTLTDD